ncbi:putative pectate lyase 13-like isoform X2, partial [Capsicum annuum]
ANPTINSQGNRYTAPKDSNTKEVTRRMDADEGEWKGWNWRTDGDIMVNGAFFVASGDGKTNQYAKASSLEPQSSDNIDQLTLNAGVFNATRDNNTPRNGGINNPGTTLGRGTPAKLSITTTYSIFFFSLLIILVL